MTIKEEMFLAGFRSPTVREGIPAIMPSLTVGLPTPE
jgi:hypothetical protein